MNNNQGIVSLIHLPDRDIVYPVPEDEPLPN